MEVALAFRNEKAHHQNNVIVHIMTEQCLQEAFQSPEWFVDGHCEILKAAAALNDFNARESEIIFVYPSSENIPLTVFVGLGPRTLLNARQFQNAGAALSKRVSKLNLQHVMLDISGLDNIDPHDMIKPFLEGIAIGAYTFTKYISESKPFPLGKMTVVIPDYVDKDTATQAVMDASHNIAASNIARRLTDEASNYKTPEKFENLVKDILSKQKYNIFTLDYNALATENLSLIRAVGQAGSDLPRLLIIETHPFESDFTLGIVGKAVTFDSGGLMIKSHEQMPYMREDVGGAAAIAGVLSVIDQLSLNYNLVAAIPIAENLIDSKSYRPSDVCITRNGHSIEINNTDAEGRLLLADSFIYLQDKYKLNLLIDVATLTGAIVRALGSKMAGYFTNNQYIADQLEIASCKSRERFWRMPLAKEYDRLLNSTYADLKNDGGEPKAITAALFLQHFVNSGLPWLHLDVGGILVPDPNDPLYGGGYFSTGIPTITLIEFLKLLNVTHPSFK
ncbi:leucyl aminopeptidase family protein [bacterium]|nr:leucyl aminopeptidase family protein [candidate division CSSED10-310 bacterium]